jgi:hypothetical protein
MKLRSFLAVALATGLCALVGVRLLRTPDAAGSGPDPAGLPATGTPDGESGGELPAPRAGTERASVEMPGIQIERERMGSASVVGLATPDFRLRSATYFAPDAQQAGVAWQADVGFPALLWSDRARATPITSAPMGNLRLRSFEPFDIRVGGASAPGVVFCQTPSPCAWIYFIGQTDDEGLLQASGADPTCLFRAVDPGRRMVSTWLPATGPELELTVDAPAVDCIVTTTEGRPISGAMVTVMDAEGHSRDAGVTDEQGRAWLRAVDGAVRWIADCPGFTPAAGSRTSPIRLRRGRSVTIEVARQNTGPVATGTLIWNGPLTFRAGVRSGLATIRDVPIESFELQMIEGDRTTATQVPAEVTHHAWLMPDALALNGRIHGLDLPGWTLALSLEGAGPRPPLFPGQDGMFRFDNVPDQDLFLKVTAILVEPAGVTELVLDRFLVHGGRYADLTLGQDSLPSSELRCKVTVPPGHTGPEHMYVVIERDGGRMMVRRVEHIMNGQCTFPHLLPGRYEPGRGAEGDILRLCPAIARNLDDPSGRPGDRRWSCAGHTSSRFRGVVREETKGGGFCLHLARRRPRRLRSELDRAGPVAGDREAAGGSRADVRGDHPPAAVGRMPNPVPWSRLGTSRGHAAHQYTRWNGVAQHLAGR